MRKLINTSGLFGLLSLISGVFYREFTKLNNYKEATVLKGTHGHFMVLGCMLFLVLVLFAKNFNLLENKKFRMFYKLYVVGLPLTVSIMYLKGILQVLRIELAGMMMTSIIIIAGLSHILVAVALTYLFLSLKEVVLSESK